MIQFLSESSAAVQVTLWLQLMKNEIKTFNFAAQCADNLSLTNVTNTFAVALWYFDDIQPFVKTMTKSFLDHRHRESCKLTTRT